MLQRVLIFLFAHHLSNFIFRLRDVSMEFIFLADAVHTVRNTLEHCWLWIWCGFYRASSL